MKININNGTVGGEILCVKLGQERSIVWIQHKMPDTEKYSPKPVQIRLNIETDAVTELAMQKGDQLVCEVEVNTYTVEKDGKKHTTTEYLVTNIYSHSHDGLPAIANTFMLSGNVARIDERGDWKTLTLAVSKAKNEPTYWLRLPIHNNFCGKLFKQGIHKGDWIFVQANLETRVFQDAAQQRQMNNDFKIQRLLGFETKYVEQSQNAPQGQTGLPPATQSGVQNFQPDFDEAMGLPNM